jgi:hypothetical protein
MRLLSSHCGASTVKTTKDVGVRHFFLVEVGGSGETYWWREGMKKSEEGNKITEC